MSVAIYGNLLPTHWHAKRLRHLARFVSGGTPSKENSSYWQGPIPWFSPKDFSSHFLLDSEDHISEAAVAQSTTTFVKAGTPVLVVRSGVLKHTIPIALTAVDGCINQDVKGVLLSGELSPRMFNYVVRGFQRELIDEWTKQGATVESIEQQFVDNTYFPVPPQVEQERIANFLDEQTARIDALIAEKENLLSAVQEFFKARLGTAVVEGLDSEGRLRPALEKSYALVRANWTLVPLKYLATFGGGMTPTTANDDFWKGDIPWVSPKDMKRFILHDSIDHISHSALEATSLKLHPVDSVLVVVRGMILAHTFPVAMNAMPVTVNQDMKVLRPKAGITAKYLAWMLRGLQPLVLSLTEESAHGTKALRTDQWANQAVPLPPLGEQQALVLAFERWEAETTELSAHLSQHIDRLREYRSSLISAAVTGQLDVSTFEAAAHSDLACSTT